MTWSKLAQWPIFLTVILLVFRKQVIDVGAFLRDVLRDRGIGIQYKARSIRIDPPGTQAKDISPPEPEPKLPPLKKIPPAGGEIDFGWLRMKEDVRDVANEVEVVREPDQKPFGNRTYQIGQRLYFAIVNGSPKDLVYPF